jgi:hypothetical protein
VPWKTVAARECAERKASEGSMIRPVVYRAAMPAPEIRRSDSTTQPVPSTSQLETPIITSHPGFSPLGQELWGGHAVAFPPNVPPGDCCPGEEVCCPVDGGIGLPAVFSVVPCLYARGEYLLWWIRDSRYPPLVTAGSLNDPFRGAIGQPGTQVLFGGNVSNDARSGARFTLGVWCDPGQMTAVEGSFFFLARRSVNFVANSEAFPGQVLARPFFVANSQAEVPQQGHATVQIGRREYAEIPAPPGIATGSITVETPSRLWGAEANLRCNLCCDCSRRLDFLGGVRYLSLDEGLHITEQSLVTSTSVPDYPQGTMITVADRFDTRNRFWGGQVGLLSEWRWGAWSVDCRGKVAIGNTHQVVDVVGYQVVKKPGALPQTYRGGLLALPSNMGRHSRDRFTVVPEINLNLSYHVADWWRVFVGYDFLYWSSVVRPGDQVDRSLDVSKIPNFGATQTSIVSPPRPAPLLIGTPFWAQGINVGMELRY